MVTGENAAGESCRTTNLLRTYWESLRKGRQVPLRSDVDPRRIEPVLHRAFIVERVAPQVARFRIAGQFLSDLMGMEVRGMPVTTFFVPDARDQAGLALEEVFRGPEAVEMSLAGEAGFGRTAPGGRMLFLPLRSDLGDISRAVGCLVTQGVAIRTPQRFAIRDIVATPVLPGRPVADWGAAPARPALVAALREPAAPYRSAPRRGHLRLVNPD